MPQTNSRPVFRGVYRLLSVIDRLSHRQGFWYRARDDEDRGETPLPLLCLIREPGAEGFLQALSHKLNDVDAREIPHVFVDAEHAMRRSESDIDDVLPGEAPPLLPLLDRIRYELNHHGYGGTRLTQFNRYRLANWLTRRRIPPDIRRDDRVGIIRVLKQWISKGRQRPDIDADGGPNFWIWILVHITPALWFWMWSRSREVRWFMKQDYMTAHSLNFLGLAERLTLNYRHLVSEEEIKKLLVHAFLKDLRSAYHRRLIPFRSQKWRRTAHTVVLLDNIAESNGGWELLHLINDVRNETGDPDPLLMVVTSDNPPPGSTEATLSVVQPDRAVFALERWWQDLPGRRQKKDRFARYLPIFLPRPEPAEAARHLLPEDEYAWYRVSFRPRPPAVLARQYVMSPLVTIIVLSSLGVGAVAFLPQIRSDCFPFAVDQTQLPRVAEYLPPDLADIEVRAVQFGTEWECIGYSDSPLQIFGNNERLRTVQKLVFAENARAVKDAKEDKNKKLVSVIYFAGLTQPQEDAPTYSALSEELEGLLILQRKLIAGYNFLLRVIVANGGNAMRHAPTVASDMIAPLIHSDLSVMGVIGMDRTNTYTEKAITQLGAEGIPTIATTLTGTGLTDRSDLYFQLVPGNDEQAKLFQQYADRAGFNPDQITIYLPDDPKDTYVQTLVQQIDIAFFGEPEKAEGELRKVSWTPGYPGQVKPRCSDEGKDIAFYVGRPGDFSGFLLEMISECSDAMPEIIGGDSTGRFFSERGSRTLEEFNGLRVSYVSMGAELVLTGTTCLKPKANKVESKDPQVKAFCAHYQNLQKELKNYFDPTVFNPFPAARSGLAYDSANLLLTAVKGLRPQPDLTDTTAPVFNLPGLALALIKTEYDGVTGTISFADSQIAKYQTMAILEFDNVYDVGSHPRCLQASGSFYGKEDRTGCPKELK